MVIHYEEACKLCVMENNTETYKCISAWWLINNMYVYVCIYVYMCGGGGGGLVAKSWPTLAIPCTVACQAPLSVGFPRQEYWSRLPFPSPCICVVYVY